MLLQQRLHAGRVVVIHPLVQPTNQNGQLDVIKLGDDNLDCILQAAGEQEESSSMQESLFSQKGKCILQRCLSPPFLRKVVVEEC